MTFWVVVFIGAAVFSLFEFLRAPSGMGAASYLSDREANATHLVMNLSMAAMLSHAYARLEVAIMTACAVAIATLAVRFSRHLSDSKLRPLAFGSAYHLLSVGAMIYAVMLMPPMAQGMMHHAATPWPALVLGALFALDAIATTVLAGVFPDRLLRMGEATGILDGSTNGTTEKLAAIRRSALPHVVMDAGMTAMLLNP